MNRNLRNIYVQILIWISLFGFFGQFVIVNQSQAIVKVTLDVSLFRNNNNDRSIISKNSNITQPFHLSYEMLINDSHFLTQSYQKEIGKWQSKQYDSKKMISITDSYLPKFQKLVNRVQTLQPTTPEYLKAKDLYVISLESEIASYMHFRNFLVTGNMIEDDTSTQLLSNALKYEIKSFAAFNNKTVTDTDNNYANRSFLPI